MAGKADEKAGASTAETGAKQAAQAAAKPQAAAARRPPKAAAETARKTAKKSMAGEEADAARQAEEKQEDQFSKAVEFFQSRKFGRARPLFEKVADGPNVGLSHRAGVYLRICRERAARAKPRLDTVEEHYNYAVQLINDARLKEAETYLNRALRMDRNAAHALYALSVLKVMNGDKKAAFEALRKSIEIDPQNRILARKDPDLAAVARQEPFRRLLTQHPGE